MIRDIGFWQGIREVASGRGQLRLILQPLMAIVLGIRLGISDAKTGADPFIWRLVTAPNRRVLLREAVMDVIIPFCLAVVIDGVLQYLMLGHLRPLAAVVVGAILIWFPFSVARSFTNRIYRRMREESHA